MNKREAKREACAFVAADIGTIDELSFLDEFHDKDIQRIMAALNKLQKELIERAGDHWLAHRIADQARGAGEDG